MRKKKTCICVPLFFIDDKIDHCEDQLRKTKQPRTESNVFYHPRREDDVFEEGQDEKRDVKDEHARERKQDDLPRPQVFYSQGYFPFTITRDKHHHDKVFYVGEQDERKSMYSQCVIRYVEEEADTKGCQHVPEDVAPCPVQEDYRPDVDETVFTEDVCRQKLQQDKTQDVGDTR